MKFYSPLAALLIAASVSTLPAFAQEETSAVSTSLLPATVRYSGTLADAGTGSVTLRFSVYAAPKGGEPIWSEEQAVMPAESGKYTVLLGSATQGGLPAAVFSRGEARWVGVSRDGQESERTILASVPYAMKAADAETLGGHSASDFMLSNTTATPVTQINVGTGLTGGGTGPTVTLGLSSSYLESLGNSVYAQLAAANTFSSSMTVKGNLTVNGTVTAPGFVNSLLTAGNGLYAQLAANNTFTGQITQNYATASGTAMTVNASGSNSYGISASGNAAGIEAVGGTIGLTASGTTAGIVASSSSSGINTYGGYYGLYGSADNTNPSYYSIGVEGITTSNTGFGVAGYAPAGTNGMGVYGQLSEGSLQGNGNFSSAAVRGDSTNNTAASGSTAAGVYVGVLGTAADSNAGAFVNNSPSGYTTLLVQSNNTSAGILTAINAGTDKSCTIDANADLSCSGTVSNNLTTRDGRTVATYGMRSAEDWMEDFGSCQLSSGSAHVSIAADFASAADTASEYHVFLTPEGDSRGLYVANRTADGFDVREQGGGTASVSFSYRIVARPAGPQAERLKDRTEELDKMARLQHFGKYALAPKPVVKQTLPPEAAAAMQKARMHRASFVAGK